MKYEDRVSVVNIDPSKLSRNDLLKGKYHIYIRFTLLYSSWLEGEKWGASAKGLFIDRDPICVKNLNSLVCLVTNTVYFWGVIKYDANEAALFSIWYVNKNCLGCEHLRVYLKRRNIPQSWQLAPFGCATQASMTTDHCSAAQTQLYYHTVWNNITMRFITVWIWSIALPSYPSLKKNDVK